MTRRQAIAVWIASMAMIVVEPSSTQI